MPQASLYALLDLPQTASADEIKRAFRQQIALYHPDKVAHLAREFQAIAAERAAALTEAYRILSNQELRSRYDQSLAATDVDAPSSAAGAPIAPDAAAQPTEPGPAAEAAPSAPRIQFKTERLNRDVFVRKAAMDRLRHALDAVADCERVEVAGFDVACVPRARRFLRARGPRLLGRFVPAVDAGSVAETWSHAARSSAGTETCVFLIGSALAPAGELANSIAEQRRKSVRTTGSVTVIPVDARNWEAHIPVDAPGIVKTVLARLRTYNG